MQHQEMDRRGGKGRRGARADPSDASDGEDAVTAVEHKATDGLDPGPAAFIQGFFNAKCDGAVFWQLEHFQRVVIAGRTQRRSGVPSAHQETTQNPPIHVLS